MTPEEFRKQAHLFVDWMADYLEGGVEKLPVRSLVKPKEVFAQLPDSPPQEGEPMDLIFKDFKDIVLPGMTHWQHPKYFAYFPANSSYPSLLAEMLTATMGAQCMLWETSPAATEVEEKVMQWLIQMLNLPRDWDGCIQTSASSSTLCAIISAREKYSDYTINQTGVKTNSNLRVYSSFHIHSSIEKAVRIAGMGSDNYVQIEGDSAYAMNPTALEEAIKKDLAAGKKPICVVAAIGTTSSTAVDPIHAIADICHRYGIWLHIDAAYSGTALILPEYRHLIQGIELADSFVFNPHKWMFTNFDCSAYFVKDKHALLRAFTILPEYLKTKTGDSVTNYKDWGVQLGRRFRALKLWFVIRNFGVSGIQAKLRHHMNLAEEVETKINEHPDFEMLAPRLFNLVCFRFAPSDWDEKRINRVNEMMLHEMNESGQLFMTHTILDGKYTLRLVIGQTNVERRHVEEAWTLILETAEKFKQENLG